MDRKVLSGRQFAAELASLKKRVDRLEKAKRGRVGNTGEKQALLRGSIVSKENMVYTSQLMEQPYDVRHAIEILWYVVKGA